MNLLYNFLNFFIGTCLASHAAVIYDRWNNKNFIFARSHCNNCLSTLSLLDEFPLISYLFLKGRCRYCQSPIPSEFFMFELIGGFAFFKIDFSSQNNIIVAFFIFNLFLVAIFDYYQNEFDLILLFPILIIAILFNKFSSFNLLEWVSFLPIVIVLSWNTFRQKIGLGDLLIYILLTLFFTPSFANLTFLFASLFLITLHLIENNSISTNYPLFLLYL